MPETWGARDLASLVIEGRPICYGVLKPGEFDPTGIPLIRIVDIQDDKLNQQNLHMISRVLDLAFKRSKLDGLELLLSIQGTIGRVAIAPPSVTGANISRTIARIAIDPSSADVRFIR